MAIKKFKPITPGQRFKTSIDYSVLTKKPPEKSLLEPLRRSGGRNNDGHITSRHIGGGHKQKYRIVDFKRNKVGIPAKVTSLEYDPNRSAFISLLTYVDGEKRYILAPHGIKVGDTIVSGPEADIHPGNALPMEKIPTGLFIHNIELIAGRGGQMARSAGAYAQLMAKEGDRRPKVRGVAMNPVDHPMGGGEGKSSGGRHPTTPWGKPTKGYKTRRRKPSDKYIVHRRKK